MSKIIFSVDSGCDIPQSLIDSNNIYVVNFPITMGGKEYRDRVDINPQMIYDYADNHKDLPKTSAVNAQEHIDHFNAIREKEGDCEIIHTAISDGVSLTYKEALKAVEEVKDVFLIDSCTLSSGIALLVLHAIDLANEGKSAKEIYDICQQKAKKDLVQTSFVIETLTYLYKGGRCSALKLLGANLLKIRPTVKLIKGKIEPVDKMKGKPTEVVKRYVQKLKEEYGDRIDTTRAFVTNSLSDPGYEDEPLKMVKEMFGFKEVIHQIAGSTITTHCGKNTLGVLFMLKE
ncbi:MAG: DegV family protein [Firmicutes bacterium]|nr:DegV family protein [Bacillota bacterium]